MRTIAIITGVLIVACGVVAAVTGEFLGLGPWLVAVALGAAGLAGLASMLLANRLEES